MPEEIQQKLIEQEMQESYVDYAMSVITSRAIPDVRDGLKPVHRRILYAMNDLGLHHNKAFKKSARIVGETLGKYHPHGDSAVYDALVRMAQDFSLRYPLVEGHGNFGSVDGDSPAAQRYTEARLAKISQEMLADIEKETVEFVPNFDNSLKEPKVLPARIPNLLINGSSGIAVAMATSIPPHNLREVIDACIAFIENQNMTSKELHQYIKGPDFPTGGRILGRGGLEQAYDTGRGKITVRGVAHVEETKIIITEIPYMVNKSLLIESMATLVKEGTIQGISDIRDESNREGMRMVIELKKGSDGNAILSSLYKHTSLSSTCSIIMIALDEGQPRVMTLRDMVHRFIMHRKEIITKRTQFDLREAEHRAHLLEGLIVCLDHIDPIVQLIKKSQDAGTARSLLMQNYQLTEVQAQAILDMKLQRLTSLESEKTRKELEETRVFIEECKSILGSEPRIFGIIKSELVEIKGSYGDERKTRIDEQGEATAIQRVDTLTEQDIVITITHAGYIKQVPLSVYKEQGRGGVGIQGAKTKDEDLIKDLFITRNKSTLLFFTNKGKVHWLPAWEVPEGSRHSKGKAIVNTLDLKEGETVATALPVLAYNESQYVLMATKKGTVKKTALTQFSNPRRGGIAAITLDEGDEVIKTVVTSGNDLILLASKQGNAAKFSEQDVREMGRSAGGVVGMRLEEQDEIVAMQKVAPHATVLTVTEKGFGKRTPEEEYRLIHRGGKGVTNIKITEKNGPVVDVLCVTDDDSIVFVTQQGLVLRVPAKTISTIGRATQGVRLVRLKEGDKVSSMARVLGE